MVTIELADATALRLLLHHQASGWLPEADRRAVVHALRCALLMCPCSTPIKEPELGYFDAIKGSD